MVRLIVIIIAIAIAGCSLPKSLRKTEWSIPEVREWANKYDSLPGWKCQLLYQGSDTIFHYFISRVIDYWAIFKLKRSELNLTDIRNHNISSSAPLGYYFVDPKKDFIKIRDY